MRTAKEMVDHINAAKLIAPWYMEYAIDIAGVSRVATIDYDEHRLYFLGTLVYKIGAEFFGVRGAVSLKSDAMKFSDVGAGCEAFEMEQAPSVTYKRKDISRGLCRICNTRIEV